METPTTKVKPWPEHINSNAFKAHSNFFVGLDEMAYFKTLVSIRTLVGSGMVLALLLALLLPTKVVMLVAAVMTIPQLFLTLSRRYGLIEDPLRNAHPVLRGRYAPEIEGDFCVFHIGLILNGHIPSKEMKDIRDAFVAMHKELEADPEKYGFLGSTTYVAANIRVDGPISLQYWRSQQQLNAYARDHMSKHFPNMLWTSKTMKSSPHIGIWHESFNVRAGEYEGIYVNCPQILLGKAGGVVPATGGRRTARGRLGVTDGKDLNQHDMPEKY